MVTFHSGGVSTYTDSWRFDAEHESGLKGIEDHHNGMPFYYCDTTHNVGLIDGQFDDDFFSEGIEAIRFKGSTGEKGIQKHTSIKTLIIPMNQKFSLNERW